MSFPSVNPKQSFPNLESEILAYWKANNTFKRSTEIREGAPEYTFYDGPPFATGTPHYGHILAGVIKDVIPRYWTMRGRYVERRFGWDCHGLPIENIVEKKLGISGKKDIEDKVGVYEFNEECRRNVFGYVDEWRKVVDKIGRWVDMDDDYKTMDADFMESVWWVFKTIYDKGLIYESYRVVPYCPRCSTPLSNFEVNQGYEDKQDKAVTVKFKVKTRQAVGVMVENNQGEVLLGYNKKHNIWHFPGGKVEQGESFEAGASRELLEETGISRQISETDIWSSQYDITDGKVWDNRTYCIQASESEICNGEEATFSEWKFFPKNALPENTWFQNSRDIQRVAEESDSIQHSNSLSILAWTTTPWTLPANLGLAVGQDVIYVELLDKASGDTYVLAQDRIATYYKNPEDYTVVREYPGSCLVGIEYEPMFDDFIEFIKEHWKNSTLRPGWSVGERWSDKKGSTEWHWTDKTYTVVLWHHVTTESGTGVVHIAPAYGIDDAEIGQKESLGFFSHIDEIGHTKNLLRDNDVYVFDFNQTVIDRLKAEKKLVHIGTIDHSYPHCYRCKTPLIYRAISAWYVNVEKIKSDMLSANANITWVPETIKEGRFGKWLEGARDWNISRNRYWGSALPVWKSEDGDIKVIGSVEELYQANRAFGDVTKLIFVRHGHSEHNLTNTYESSNLSNLTEEGRRQAQEVFERFKDEHIDVVYSSPFDRCKDTIKQLAEYKHLSIIEDARLREIHAGKLDGKEIVNNFTPLDEVKIWETGESQMDCQRRVSAFLQEIVAQNPWKTILASSHGEPLTHAMYFLGDFNEFTPEVCDQVYPGKWESFVRYVFSDSCKPIDLHKHFVDKIRFEKDGKIYTRIPEVLDCWFESGSMPYAQKHYPFENKERFEASFPADFICEGLDQTRGWFYTLVVLAAALYGAEPFKNVIVNGIVLAEDGRKMSKSLQNYPDPMGLIDKHGADSIRFYLMNSQAVRAEDFRFAESGVEETVKKVILPLWNTYSFFTTYANIDSWQPSGTRVHFVRHGQTNTNIEGRLSDGIDNSPLNETGRAQVRATGERLRQDGQEFDIIIASTLDRAMQTAEIIAAEIGHVEKIILEDDITERRAPKYSGKFHTDIVREHFEQTGETVEVHHSAKIWTQDGSDETEDQFCERIAAWYDRILAEYPGKRILVVSHAGVYRALNTYANGFDRVEAFSGIKSLVNAEVAEVPAYIRSNPLDRFILGELQTLIARTNDALEGYDLQRAARSIVDFMDDLTNWYVRRSRRRFWESGLTTDKVAAYETLHRVLVDLTKILAPFCPFVSEHVYRSLTGGESVHLDRYPTFERTWVSPSLLSSMKKAKDLVTLGLALRGREKIRVRQPLARVVIGEQFDPYYLEIIREELNIKEVEIADMSSIARKICKPNARLIGAKFGKSVQDIIREAKAGNFTELDGGRIQVGEYVLEAGEFEVAYEPLDVSGLQVEGGSGTVIAIDTTITDELRIEGYARDIVRSIQDARKEAGYEVTDRIRLAITGSDSASIVSVWWDHIASETLATLDPSLTSGDIEREVDMEGVEVRVIIKR